MVKNLHPTPYHRAVMLFFGKKAQLSKVIEEIEELVVAVKSKDRIEIIKELADVENTIPYLKLLFLYDTEIRIERLPDSPDFDTYSFLLITLLKLRQRQGDSVLSKKITSLCLTGFCNSLYNLYIEYGIDAKDVNSIIDYKKKRTLKRIATRYYKKEESYDR